MGGGNKLTTIIVGVVVVVGLTLTAVVGISLTTDPHTATPLYAAVFGFASATIPALFALAKLDNVSNQVSGVKADLRNGTIPNKVLEAFQHPDVQEVLREQVSHSLRNVLNEPVTAKGIRNG